MSVLYLAIVCNIFFYSVAGQKLRTCPGVFQYEGTNETGYLPIKGVIQFHSQLPINLTVVLIIPALLRTTYGGRLELDGSKSELQRNFDVETDAAFRFNLYFPADLPIPQIKLIKLNNLHLCSYTSPHTFGTVVTYTYSVKRVFTGAPSGRPGSKRVRYQWNFHVDFKQYNGPTHHGQPLLSAPAPDYRSPGVNYPQTENPTRHHLDDNPLEVILDGTSGGESGNKNFATVRPGAIPFNLDDACGKPIRLNPLVAGGLQIERGGWPWLVALFQSKGTRLEFSCGATLVSDQFLVTAAHCVSDGSSSVRRGIKAYIGKYDLSNWDEPESYLADIRDIYVHPEYDMYKGFTSDIAVLKLRQSVRLSLYVIPACLLFEEDYQRLDAGDSEGIVVGWGRETPEGSISPVPKMISLPIVSKEECLESDINLKLFTTNTTFCAGKRNGVGPCSGDSGSGLFISKTDGRGNVRWYLRGVVSLSVPKSPETPGLCDLSNYFLFTDVFKFRDWLSQYI